MFAVGIQWTDKAKAMITAREYRYVSPVFNFDKDTGVVERILSVAITNNPALPYLTDLGNIAINSANFKKTNDLDNQRGYELLARMNADNDKAKVRLSSNDAAAVATPKPSPQFIDTGDMHNQRGMELLRRMLQN